MARKKAVPNDPSPAPVPGTPPEEQAVKQLPAPKIVQREKKLLRCILTPEEQTQAVRDLVNGMAEQELVVARAAQAAAKYRGEAQALAISVKKHATIVREGAEDRMVDCVTYHYLDTLECVVVRDDTGEVVHRRPLSYAERQGELFPSPDPPAADKAPEEPAAEEKPAEDKPVDESGEVADMSEDDTELEDLDDDDDDDEDEDDDDA